MFSVIFEVHPRRERADDYLALAAHLKPRLEKVEGFLDNERFESKRRPGWVLSHSTWRDEKSLVRWRTDGEHHGVQERGRFEVFSDYRIRVGNITADTHPPSGYPVTAQRLDETEVGNAKFVTLTEIVPKVGALLAGQVDELALQLGLPASAPDLIDHDVFASIYTKGKMALLISWRSGDFASNWKPAPSVPAESVRNRCINIVRDYSMFDRREAPQYYQPVPRVRSLSE
jgi:heme-degrading monooxygenase HmoA